MRIYGQKPKKGKNYEAHTSPTKYGMGDYYGTGIRAKLGTIRDSSNVGFIPVSAKKLKSPPRSVV
jgi:hypothetical protein